VAVDLRRLQATGDLCYTSLIAAAEEVGDSETARMCEGILQTQKQQADQLLPLIPALTRKYMQCDAAEVAAKRQSISAIE
jgi:hypothetical protein